MKAASGVISAPVSKSLKRVSKQMRLLKVIERFRKLVLLEFTSRTCG